MTLTLDLPSELQERLSRGADRQSLSMNDYVLRILETKTREVAPPENGAALVEYWERAGVLGIWADRTDIEDSSKYARELRHEAETRGRP